MVNRHRAYWSSMSTGKFDYEPDKLDEKLKDEEERYQAKKETIQAMFDGMLKSDPVRQDETFSIFIDVLKDWKIKRMEGSE